MYDNVMPSLYCLYCYITHPYQVPAKDSKGLYFFLSYSCLLMVAHGRVVTSSCQIPEVKQCRARLVLGWVTDAWVMLLAMCGHVGQASHIMLPLTTQQWWVPGRTKNRELWMALQKNALNSPQRRWDHIRVSSKTRGVNCEVCKTRRDIRL